MNVTLLSRGKIDNVTFSGIDIFSVLINNCEDGDFNGQEKSKEGGAGKMAACSA